MWIGRKMKGQWEVRSHGGGSQAESDGERGQSGDSDWESNSMHERETKRESSGNESVCGGKSSKDSWQRHDDDGKGMCEPGPSSPS